MADNDVRRARATRWLGVPVLALVVGAAWGCGGGDTREFEAGPDRGDRAGTMGVPGATVGTMGAGEAIEEYVEFAGLGAEPDEQVSPEAEAPNVAEGVRRLTAALEDLMGRTIDAEVHELFERYREAAAEAQGGGDAAWVREVFLRATDVIGRLGTAPPAGELRSIAESLDPDQPLAQQHARVQAFFRESARLLQFAGRV
jgi:hypothetical protein